jgi:hypothetical protein
VSNPRRFATDRCSLDLPDGMTARVVGPPPECTSMAHIRGDLAASAPAVIIVTSRALRDTSVRALARKLAGSFTTPTEPQPIDVPGTNRSLRVDGLIEIEEGLTEDWIERIAIVVAARRDEAITLTVRTRPADDVAGAVEALIASFAIS